MGNVDGMESADVTFIRKQEVPAGRKVIIHDVENLTLNPGHPARQNNRVGAVRNVSQRNAVATSQMQKDSESVNSHPAGDGCFARAVHGTRPYSYVRHSK